MPSLRGVVVHDGYSNLVWASEDWDLGDELDSVKDAISSALTDPAEFPGVVRLDADRAVYSIRRARRARRAARRREPAGPTLRRAHRGAPAALRAPAPAAGARVPAPRIVAALQARVARTGSRRARTRSVAHARDVVEPDRDRRCGRVRPHPEERAGAHGLRPGGSLGAGQEHRPVADSQRKPDVGRLAAPRPAAPDGVDAAAAAHHRRQSHLQGGDRRRRAVQDSRLPGASPVRARDGCSGAVQSRERA